KKHWATSSISSAIASALLSTIGPAPVLGAAPVLCRADAIVQVPASPVDTIVVNLLGGQPSCRFSTIRYGVVVREESEPGTAVRRRLSGTARPACGAGCSGRTRALALRVRRPM